MAGLHPRARWGSLGFCVRPASRQDRSCCAKVATCARARCSGGFRTSCLRRLARIRYGNPLCHHDVLPSGIPYMDDRRWHAENPPPLLDEPVSCHGSVDVPQATFLTLGHSSVLSLDASYRLTRPLCRLGGCQMELAILTTSSRPSFGPNTQNSTVPLSSSQHMWDRVLSSVVMLRRRREAVEDLPERLTDPRDHLHVPGDHRPTNLDRRRRRHHGVHLQQRRPGPHGGRPVRHRNGGLDLHL